MPPRSFRIISFLITTLLLATLITVIVLVVQDPNTALRANMVRMPTATRQQAVLQATQQAASRQAIQFVEEVQRIEGGGFAFRAPVGYAIARENGSVTLSSSDESGAVYFLSGGSPAQFVSGSLATLEEMFNEYVDSVAAKDNFQRGESQPVTVSGVEGLSVDLVGAAPNSGFAGRIVMVQPGEEHLFIMSGVAPVEHWQAAAQADFDALLATVTLFTPPAQVAAVPTEQAEAAAIETPLPENTPSPEPRTTPQLPTLTATSTDEAAPDEESTATVSAAPTSDANIIPSPTPTLAIEVAPAEIPTVEGNAPVAEPADNAPWRIYSNGNYAQGIAAMRSTLWTATGGGVVAWNKNSGSYVKFTTVDGLSTNHLMTAESCPIPGFGVLFGSLQGLQVFDMQNGSWKTLNSSNSPMSYDDVVALYCEPAYNFLVVAYAQHGLDVFDADTGTWSHFDRNNGLMADQIRDVVVVGDRQAIWVASQTGVAVLERNEDPVLYTTENSLLDSNQIRAIAGSGTETVWIATSSTLYRTNGQNWFAYNRNSVLDSEFPAGRLGGLAVAQDGSVWLAADSGEVCHFDPIIELCSEFFRREEGMVAGSVTSLSVGPEGDVYYTTAGAGISMYDGTAWKALVIDNELVPGNSIRDISQAADGSIWVATNGGAQQLSNGSSASNRTFTPSNSPLPAADLRVVEPGRVGDVWFGANGVSYTNGATWTNYTVADGLAGLQVQTIVVDNQNRTWIGTQTGLSIWTGSTFFNLKQENGLPSDDITALAVDGNAVWIGTKAGLLRFQDNQLQVFTDASMNLPSDVITALAIDSENGVLIGTEQGLARFKDNTTTIDANMYANAPVGAVSALAAGENGEIWLAIAGGGLYHFDGESWSPFAEPDKLPFVQITALLVDRNGALWIGGANGGLARYRP